MKKLIVRLESKEAIDIFELMNVKCLLASEKNIQKLNKLGFSLSFEF